MNSLCKQYISEVKLLLPAIGKSEKKKMSACPNFYSIFIMLNSNFNESRYHL